ncbi:hypothetical protein DFH09DRAFT_1397664, partial [Mycena vulgaris]
MNRISLVPLWRNHTVPQAPCQFFPVQGMLRRVSVLEEESKCRILNTSRPHALSRTAPSESNSVLEPIRLELECEACDTHLSEEREHAGPLGSGAAEVAAVVTQAYAADVRGVVRLECCEEDVLEIEELRMEGVALVQCRQCFKIDLAVREQKSAADSVSDPGSVGATVWTVNELVVCQLNH